MITLLTFYIEREKKAIFQKVKKKKKENLQDMRNVWSVWYWDYEELLIVSLIAVVGIAAILFFLQSSGKYDIVRIWYICDNSCFSSPCNVGSRPPPSTKKS
jgi:hypothetical protein